MNPPWLLHSIHTKRLQETHHFTLVHLNVVAEIWPCFFLSFFSCVFIPFHYVRPLLYKGHSIGLFPINLHSNSSNTTQLWSVLSKCVCESSSISWVLANSSGVLVSLTLLGGELFLYPRKSKWICPRIDFEWLLLGLSQTQPWTYPSFVSFLP